jgi:predicted DNA-binding transcriptional regulator YafY
VPRPAREPAPRSIGRAAHDERAPHSLDRQGTPAEPSANSRLKRLIRLLDELQAGRFPNTSRLATLLQTSRRTVFRDLRTLQDAGVAIGFDPSRKGYFLLRSLHIPPETLSVAEAASLLLMCRQFGEPARGVPFHSAAQSAADKILRILPATVRTRVAEMTSMLDVWHSPTNRLHGAEPHYEQLLLAGIERRAVRIHYDSASDATTLRTLLSPYRLLFSRRSWYVVGRSSLHRQVRMFNLGRILRLELTDQRYRIPPGFQLSKHLGKAWALIREPGRPQLVRLRFSQKVAKNVAEVQWHPTQQVQWGDDGQLEFQVTVAGLQEISWWILGYGDQVTVIAPEALRQLIRQRAQRMVEQYSDEEPTGVRTVDRK